MNQAMDATLKAEAAGVEGLELMRGAVNPLELVGSATRFIDAADLLLKYAQDCGVDVPQEMKRLTPGTDEDPETEADPLPLPTEDIKEFRFHCPALGKELTLSECVTNALTGAELECSLDCSTGTLNADRLGCLKALELLEVS